MRRKTYFNLVFGIVILMALIPGKVFAASNDFPNYFTMGENDTVKLSVSDLGREITLPVRAHFSELVCGWDISLSYPSGITATGVERTPAMEVHYLDSLGQDQVCRASLAYGEEYATLASTIRAQCYHDPYGYGVYLPYGNATWATGDYDEMFRIKLLVDASFKQGILALNCHFTIKEPGGAGSYTYIGVCYSPLTFIVDYIPGDVNGDGLVNITDVTLLIGWLLNNGIIDVGELPAADVNGDGLINITDVTRLIEIVLEN